MSEGQQYTPIPLHAVTYQDDGGQWIAHCLELDIAAEGATKKAAEQDLGDLCRLQVESADDVDSILRDAPHSLWDLEPHWTVNG